MGLRLSVLVLLGGYVLYGAERQEAVLARGIGMTCDVQMVEMWFGYGYMSVRKTGIIELCRGGCHTEPSHRLHRTAELTHMAQHINNRMPAPGNNRAST